MPRDIASQFFSRPHNQVAVGRRDLGVRFMVDEGVAVAVQRLLDAGYRTLHSCQWDGFRTKKFPAYINPGRDNDWERIAALQREKAAQPEARALESVEALRNAEAMQAMADSSLAIIESVQAMAEIIGLTKGEYRTYRCVLWFRPWV